MLLDDIPLRVNCRKSRAGGYILQYFCPLTGTKRQVPVRRSGKFVSKEAALEWAKENLPTIVKYQLRFIRNQEWRLNKRLVRQYSEYAKWRKEEHARSAMQEMSMLSNYVLPFFVTVSKINDPNKWCDLGEEFMVWLQKDARTRDGKPLALSTANRVLSAANQYLKWLRRKKYIEYGNLKPFEYFDPRKLPRRSSEDLVPDDIFQRVHEYLGARSELYADMYYIQRKLGPRINELIGYSFNWVSDQCPDYIREEFEARGYKVFGSMYLESQPAKQYITRDAKGNIPRVPLKWRPRISPDCARTTPILDEMAWNILVRRYEIQCDLWDQQKYGNVKENYLLFDGAQAETYRDLIRNAYEAIGLEYPGGTHVLRHSISTEWTAAKILDRVIEIVLGHKKNAHELYVHIVGQINAERLKAAPMPRLRKSVEKESEIDVSLSKPRVNFLDSLVKDAPGKPTDTYELFPRVSRSKKNI